MLSAECSIGVRRLTDFGGCICQTTVLGSVARRGREVAESTDLFSVVDFPEEGLPTSPIRQSRGMIGCFLEKNVTIRFE